MRISNFLTTSQNVRIAADLANSNQNKVTYFKNRINQDHVIEGLIVIEKFGGGL